MKVKLKSAEEFQSMVRKNTILLQHASDSGEVYHYGTVGNPSHILAVWYDEYGKEYLVVDHPNPISRESYEKRKVFFEEESNSHFGVGFEDQGTSNYKIDYKVKE